MPACAPHSSLGFLVKRKRISTSSYRSFSGHASIIWVSFAIPTKKTLPRSTCLTKSLHEKAIVDFENSCPCNARSLEPTTGKKKGQILQVLVEGPSEEHEWVFAGRHAGQAPDIDGHVLFSESDVQPGEIWSAEVLTSSDYDLVVRIQGDTPIAKARLKKILPVLPSR